MTSAKNKALRSAGFVIILVALVQDFVADWIIGRELIDSSLHIGLIILGFIITLYSFRDYRDYLRPEHDADNPPETLARIDKLINIGWAVVAIDVVFAFIPWEFLIIFPFYLINIAYVLAGIYFIYQYKKHTTDSFLLAGPSDK
ncbi:MAG: hypothetical protein ACLFQX_08375 [Candidatus Kapaibacterium sp.]